MHDGYVRMVVPMYRREQNDYDAFNVDINQKCLIYTTNEKGAFTVIRQYIVPVSR